jgi:hypothetical protein
MKQRHANVVIALFVLILVLSGCTSVPTDATPRQQTIANAVEDVISIGLVPVLAKNATYLAEARGVAAILGTFDGGELTPADVDAFLARLKVAPEDARAIGGVVNAAWATYSRRYAEQVGKSVRPDVKLFLGAVSRGILAAVAAVPAA